MANSASLRAHGGSVPSVSAPAEGRHGARTGQKQRQDRGRGTLDDTPRFASNEFAGLWTDSENVAVSPPRNTRQ